MEFCRPLPTPNRSAVPPTKRWTISTILDPFLHPCLPRFGPPLTTPLSPRPPSSTPLIWTVPSATGSIKAPFISLPIGEEEARKARFRSCEVIHPLHPSEALTKGRRRRVTRGRLPAAEVSEFFPAVVISPSAVLAASFLPAKAASPPLLIITPSLFPV